MNLLLQLEMCSGQLVPVAIAMASMVILILVHVQHVVKETVYCGNPLSGRFSCCLHVGTLAYT